MSNHMRSGILWLTAPLTIVHSSDDITSARVCGLTRAGKVTDMVWFRLGWRGRAAATPSSQHPHNTPPRRFGIFGGRRYLNDVSYFLPKDATEINRLDFQHFLFRHAMHGNFSAPIQQPLSILDVGTGTGRWATEMARQFPQANVIGLDLVAPPADDTNSTQKSEPRPENYIFVQGNVLEGLPFPDRTFDFVHQRLLVAGIPLTRWPGVVNELLRVTTPGGWVELLEAIPARGGPAMNQLYEWLVGVGLPRGVDIRTTHQIGQYLLDAGAQQVNYRQLDMPMGNWGDRSGVMMEANYFALHQGIRGPLLAQGVTTAAEFDTVMARAKAEIAEGHYIWPYFLAYGQRPLR